MIKIYLKRPTKPIKPTMNHFSLFVNLLGWDTRSLGADATVFPSSLDMASHRMSSVINLHQVVVSLAVDVLM